MFRWKTFYKYSFLHFSVFDSIKKTSKWKTIFSQQKNLIKIMLIFIGCFPKKKRKGKQSLSHAAHNSYKYYLFFCLGNNIFFHAFSLSHNNSKEHFLENNLIFRCLVMTLKMSLRIFSSVWFQFFLLLLGSKTLGSKCIRTSMCNVGKLLSKH